jgi:hypothetical protein
MKIQYDLFFWRDLAVCMKTKHFILFYFHFFIILFVFLRKPGILILDLYLYSIKIQTNILKCNKIFVENHIFFKRIFFLEFFFGLGPTRPMWLGWT